MASLEELRAVRLAKVEKLRSLGIDPYPAVSQRSNDIGEVLVKFDELKGDGKEYVLVGRAMSIRGQGALAFIDLADGTGFDVDEKGTIQAFLKKNDAPAYEGHPEVSGFELFTEVADQGDFIEVRGTLDLSRTGEKTIFVKSWRMLTKSLLPLPDSWFGLKDEDERMRHRYIDFLLRPVDTRGTLKRKSMFWREVRNFLESRRFLEVETPMLEVTTGGAEARPFKTHHNDFDMPVYLRISVGELWQKRLMAGGFDRTFEIGRVFRNEGSSPEHTQEFTNMELYAAYMDNEAGMKLSEELIKKVVERVWNTLDFDIRGKKVSLAGTWDRIDYAETIKKFTGVDIETASTGELAAALDKLEVKYEGDNRERLTDSLWKYCRKQIDGPVWLTGHPVLISPLSKLSADGKRVERSQLILAGAEVTNGYAELNDPIEQQKRFEEQQKLIDSGDEEAMMPDHEFVEMLEYGMPPTFSIGFGERLFSFLEGKPLRETQAFPLMRPKGE
jgi:lysyl-tRNA synthetase class 2